MAELQKGELPKGWESFEYLNYVWFKYSKGFNGTNTKMIKNYLNDCRKDDEISFHIQSSKLGFAYTNVKINDTDKLLNKNRNIFEYIKMPCKAFFDIENYEENKINEVINKINEYFPNANMAISGSEGIDEKKKVIKYSYHITLTNYVYTEKKTLLTLKYFCDYIGVNLGFDNCVYREGYFKAINQSKLKSNRVQSYISGPEKLSKHLITCDFDNNNITDFIPDIINQKFTMELAKNNIGILKFDLNIFKNIQPKKYLSSDIDIYDLKPLEILEYIPCYARNHKDALCHNTIFNILTWAKNSGIEYTDFFNWLSQKENTENYFNYWFSVWNSADKYTPRNTKFIIEILKCVYGPFVGTDKRFIKFKKQNSLKSTNIINDKYIKITDFNDNKYQLLFLGMGSGKTKVAIDYINENKNKSVLWITPRQTLSYNTKERLHDFIHYKEYSTAQKKHYYLNKQDKLIIQLESLHYISNKNYDIIIIDEIETLNNIWTGETMSNSKKAITWEIFKRILKNCQKCLMLDAFMTTKTIDLIKYAEENNNYDNINIISRIKQDYTRNIIEIKSHGGKLESYKLWFSNIINDIKNDKKLFIFYPYINEEIKKSYVRDSINGLKLKIMELTNLKADEIICHHSKSGNYEELKNTNEYWKKSRVVICNTSITVGVNYENDDFDNIYIYYSSSFLPRDIIQNTYRIRNLKSKNIYLVKGTGSLCKDIEIKNCDIPDLNNFIKSLAIEQQNKTYKVFKYFCNKAGYKFINDECISTQVSKEINNIINESVMPCDYNNIDDLSENKLTEKIQENHTDETDFITKLRIDKFYYTIKFKYNTENNILSQFYNGLNRKFFDTYYKIKKTETHEIPHPLLKLMLINGNKSLISDTFDKIPKDLRHYIFDYYKFDRISHDCSDNLLISRMYKGSFGIDILTIKDNKKYNLEICDEEYINMAEIIEENIN